MFGITSALSVEGPTEKDKVMTEDLQSIFAFSIRSKTVLETIEPYGAFDTPDGLSHRIQVLTKLNELVKDFVRKVAKECRLPEHLHGELGGKIYTFGSYRLGVHTSDGDIDTLCVVPQHVTRHHFFTIFLDMLKVPIFCPNFVVFSKLVRGVRGDVFFSCVTHTSSYCAIR